MRFIHPHLHFLDHLLAERANLCGAGDGHVLGALVLAGDTIEGCGVVLHVVIQVRLAKTDQKKPSVKASLMGMYFKWRECVNALLQFYSFIDTFLF